MTDPRNHSSPDSDGDDDRIPELDSDKSEFLELVETHTLRLRAAVRSLGIDQSTADDILQDALLVAWNRFDIELHGAAFPAWVVGIARRLVLNHRRRGARRWNLLQNQVAGFLAARRPETPSLLQKMATSEQLEAVRECMETMDEESRLVLEQRYFRGLSPTEIAEINGTNSNMVRQQLHRVRQRMARCVRTKLGTDLFE